jgi:chromosomal replication initiation ATPase DnaA
MIVSTEQPACPYTTEMIVAATEDVFNISLPMRPGRLSKTRVDALSVAVYVTKTHLQFSNAELAERFKKDFSTITWHTNRMKQRPDLHQRAALVKEKLRWMI